MRNIKLTLEYDGTDFSGSQLQAGGRTVQGELEAAVGKLTGKPREVRCKVNLAGRTDAGVHAAGQVANFLTEADYPIETFRKGLNAVLPEDVSVTRAEEVADDFHARFSAKERTYCYSLLNRPSRSALNHRFTHWVAEKLDVALMQEAATRLIGQHDFASFAGSGMSMVKPGEGRPSTVRCMTRLECLALADKLEIWLSANAFLPQMVRNIVGTLLMVGRGKFSLIDFEDIFAAQDRRAAGPTAPACGLTLVSVSY
jgi:tRNA pseudouridine38-40 synthase